MKKFLRLFLAVLFSTSLSSAQAGADFDHSHRLWTKILSEHVNGGLVNYKKLKAQPRDLEEYLKILDSIQKSDTVTWSKEQKLSFWINAYNALILKAIIDHYPITSPPLSFVKGPKNSIQQIPGAWDKLKFHIKGRILSLDDIEHQIIRRQFQEPRIHFALVCGALGCPNLRPEAYTAEKLDEQLEDQTRSFLSNPKKFKIIRERKMVRLNAIFKWYSDDFIKEFSPTKGFVGHPKAIKSSLNFISRYLNPDDRDYLINNKYRIKWYRYDWSLNDSKKDP